MGLELAGLAIPFLRISRGVPLDGDIGPALGHVGIEGQPLLKTRLRVRLDGFSRAFWLADAAINAFVGVDDEHVLAFVETIHGADFHAIHIFALDAILADDVGHASLHMRHLPAAGFRFALANAFSRAAQEARSKEKKSPLAEPG